MSSRAKKSSSKGKNSSSKSAPIPLLVLWQSLLNLRVRFHQRGYLTYQVDEHLDVLELRRQISKEYLKYVIQKGRDPTKMLMGATRQIIEKYGEYWRH